MAGRPSKHQYKQDQARAKWTTSLTKTLVDIMAEQVLKGNRPNNSFGKKAWKCICDEFRKKTGLKWEKDQLKNRYGVLRRQYVTVKSILDQSDFSWDESRHMVTAKDEVWDKYIKAHPDAEAIRTNGCPIYRQLCTVFSETGANGTHDQTSHHFLDEGTPRFDHGAPTTVAPEESSSHSEDLDTTNEEPSPGSRKRNRNGIDDVMAEAMLEMVAASKMRTAAVKQSNDRFSIAKCIKALDEMQGLDERIYFAALDLFDSPSARETFIALKSEKRLRWLKGKFVAPSL